MPLNGVVALSRYAWSITGKLLAQRPMNFRWSGLIGVRKASGGAVAGYGRPQAATVTAQNQDTA